MKVVERFKGERRAQSQGRQRHGRLESGEDFVERVGADSNDRALVDGRCLLGAGPHHVAHDEDTHRFLVLSLRSGPLLAELDFEPHLGRYSRRSLVAGGEGQGHAPDSEQNVA